MKIKGSVFVVTGGASGLGAATSLALLNGGGKVVIYDLPRQEADAKPLVDLGATFLGIDVINEADVKRCVAKTVAMHGQIDGCICCAGMGRSELTVNRKGNPPAMSSFELIVKVNLFGTYSVCSKCAAAMIKNKKGEDGERGTIIMCANVAAFDGPEGQSSYAASKAALVGMTLPMARDLSRYGIRVNTIAPGTFATTEAGARPPRNNGQLFPKGRWGLPREWASLALELIKNKMINGETIRIDGGIRMPKL